MGNCGSGPILVNEELCVRRTYSFCQTLTVIAAFRIIQLLPDGHASVMFEFVFFVPALHSFTHLSIALKFTKFFSRPSIIDKRWYYGLFRQNLPGTGTGTDTIPKCTQVLVSHVKVWHNI